MIKMVVGEINGRQYSFEPGKVVEVDKIKTTGSTLTLDKVLMVVDDQKVETGTPFLKNQLTLEVLGTQKGPKGRMSIYGPKANHHRVRGYRREVTQVRLAAEGNTKADKKGKSS